MTNVSMLHSIFHFLTNSQFITVAQNLAKLFKWDYISYQQNFQTSQLTHMFDVSTLHKILPYFTIDTRNSCINLKYNSSVLLIWYTYLLYQYFNRYTFLQYWWSPSPISSQIISGLGVHPLSSPKPWSTSPIFSHTTQCI